VAQEVLAGNSVVLRAPCGSGKTEAVILPFLIGRRSSLPSRLIYSLPTRALVDDIVGRVSEQVNKLDRSGSSVIVKGQHGARSEDKFFKADLIVATIDQTIGAYCATPLSLPSYLGNIPAGAAVSSMLCFDEVHTYDPTLALQAMLVLIDRANRLRLPCVVMSATLPDALIDRLTGEWSLRFVEGRDEDVQKRRDRRVTVRWVGRCMRPEDLMRFSENRRVMVVCNSVSRAQALYKELMCKVSPLFLLHSRFLPADRSNIEKEMKDCFKKRHLGVLVTTQVCEVGLDISCDVMLTDLAPIDSLIQRMGRCAREGNEGEAYVFDVKAPSPYDEQAISDCRKYLVENFDNRVVGWDEELEAVNSLLSESFSRILNDADQRTRILNHLAQATFEGDKSKVEQSVRELLSANLSVHEDPRALGRDVSLLPWIPIDVRVLNQKIRKGAKVWCVEWCDDEKGTSSPAINLTGTAFPYGYYVIHPESASYDSKRGLVFGELGCDLPLRESDEPHEEEPPKEYQAEKWTVHAYRCLDALKKLDQTEESTIKILAKSLDLDQRSAMCVLAHAVGLHDIGKLNETWQNAAGATGEPLAHVEKFISNQPPHAAISAYALQDHFGSFVESRSLCSAIAVAIGHHHHTRAIDVPSYTFVADWRRTVSLVCDRIAKMYGTYLGPEMIKPSSAPSMLDTRMPEFGKTRLYTAYATISRMIRLSDRLSFSMATESENL
jgi:CRISPR-associated endonuclease/helicase Cas3